MNYDFDMPSRTVHGTPIYRQGTAEEYFLSHALADFIESMPTGKQALKFWGWAEKLYKDGNLDLDESDVLLLKEFITTNPSIQTCYAGQLLRILSK